MSLWGALERADDAVQEAREDIINFCNAEIARRGIARHQITLDVPGVHSGSLNRLLVHHEWNAQLATKLLRYFGQHAPTLPASPCGRRDPASKRRIQQRNEAVRAALKKPGATYESVAKQFGITRQRVHQIKVGYNISQEAR